MKSFQIHYQLKQHTPIIHFQHQQEGATLRATELKPKLDRFLASKLTGISNLHEPDNKKDALEALQTNYSTWLIGGKKAQHLAFDYKVRITAPNERPQRYLIASYIPKYRKPEYKQQGFKLLDKTPYFANNQELKQGKPNDAKQGLYYKKKPIQLTITCFDTALLEEVKKIVPYVFAYENFGTRQSKGFGGFLPNGIVQADEYETLLKDHQDYKTTLKLVVKGNDLSSAFRALDNEYKILKGGFGKDESQIKLHFEERNIEWEKPILKRKLIGGRGNPKRENLTGKNAPKYVRVLLGLAELYEFPQKKAKISIKASDGIERFKSPITIKVFQEKQNMHIYLLAPSKIEERIHNASYTFSILGRENGQKEESITLQAPATFDLQEFLKNHVAQSWSFI